MLIIGSYSGAGLQPGATGRVLGEVGLTGWGGQSTFGRPAFDIRPGLEDPLVD